MVVMINLCVAFSINKQASRSILFPSRYLSACLYLSLAALCHSLVVSTLFRLSSIDKSNVDQEIERLLLALQLVWKS